MNAVRIASSRWKSFDRWPAFRNFSSSIVKRTSRQNILDTLSSRSLLAQVTAPNSLRKHLDGQEQRSVYVGVDPSADSLHVGNLLPLLAALHFVQHGHRVVIVIGGATGSIGDPSGRSTERSALSPSELDHNVSKITEQVQLFFKRAEVTLRGQVTDVLEAPDYESIQGGPKVERTPMQEAAEVSDIDDAKDVSQMAMNEATSAPGSQAFSGVDKERKGTESSSYDVTVVNNQEWYKNMNVLTFLRDVGKYARVGTMLARDSVKSRMQPSDAQSPAGLSFTEFSYQLLQAYDFSVLNRAPWHCTVQLGGSDQMGNIMAGVDLIRRQKILQESKGEEGEDSENVFAYGLTLPLLTTANGSKFGKSAGNAIWISSEKCSDYEFYQFFYRSRDDEVELYLKTLTMLSMEMIQSVMRAHQDDPSSRRAQKILATQVTELVRGKQAVKRAEAATRVLFETQLSGLEAEDVMDAFKGDSRLIQLEKSKCIGLDLKSVAVQVGLTKTKGEAKRFIAGGGFYINNKAVSDVNQILQQGDLVCNGKIIVLRIGKTEHRIVSVV